MTVSPVISSWMTCRAAALLLAFGLTLGVVPGLAVPSARAAELVMFEQAGCHWCKIWDEQIAPIYPKTEEGALAPLRRVDIHKPMPEDLSWMRGERFTPSFALVHEGKEYGRIRGYPGEDFFWGLLAQMIAKLRDTVSGLEAPVEGRPAPAG